MEYLKFWLVKTGVAEIWFIVWIGIVPSKFYDWKKHYEKVLN
jgi:hypothetical protein